MAASRARDFKNTAAKATQPIRDARRCFIIISGTTVDTADVRVDGQRFHAGRGNEREHALGVPAAVSAWYARGALRREIVERQETALPPLRAWQHAPLKARGAPGRARGGGSGAGEAPGRARVSVWARGGGALWVAVG